MEVIDGATDGILTTFTVVAGVAGAALNPGIELVLGAANLFAVGFSMGMSDYPSGRSEMDDKATVERESDGAADGGRSLASTAVVAFVVAGWAPLASYGLVVQPVFPSSIAVTGLALFVAGASRSLVTRRSWYCNGGEMFVVGMAAASVASVVGDLMRGLA